MSRRARRALILVLAALALSPVGAGAQTAPPTVALTDITVERGAEVAEVRLKLSGPVVPKTALMDGPWRLVLDLEGVEHKLKKLPDKPPDKPPNKIAGDPIRAVRASQYRVGVTRVVIEMTRRAAWAVESTPDGLRVMFPTTPTPARAAAPKPAPAAPPKGTPEIQGIIVRDDVAVAYIRDPATKQVKGYRVGDKVGDAVIEKIAEREVVLTTPTGRVEIRLEERKPGK